jgi:deoxyribonucleoside regulator
MKRDDRVGLLYKVAQLYYEGGIKKYEIGKLVNQSPSQVGNLLAEARKKGIVKIEIGLPRLQLLQNKLKSTFGLLDVIVVPYDADCPGLLKQLGQAAAEYFEDSVLDGAKVALGGGYLMYEMISALSERKRDVQLFPAAIIGRGSDVTHIDPMILVTLLWAKSGHLQRRAHYVTVTPLERIGDRRQVQKHYSQLRRNKKVHDLFEAMKTVDWVFASIGGLNADDDYVSATQYATKNLMDEMKLDDDDLKKEGVVGDIVYSFFNGSGDTKPSLDIGITLGVRHLKAMVQDSKKRVVVVAGSYKLEALKAVLRGQICNVLITDANAADRLLRDSGT